MKNNIVGRLYTGFIVAFILSGAVGLISYVTFKRQIEQAKWVRHTYEVMNQVQRIQNIVVDMETGRRAFRSTNEKLFLEPYNSGLVRIMPAVYDLRKLVADNQEEVGRAEMLEQKINKQLTFWAQNGEDASNYDKASLTNIATTEKIQMDAIRNVLNQMLKYENNLLSIREQKNQRSVEYATWELILGTILIQIIILTLIYFILTEFNNRRKAETALKENLTKLEILNQESNDKNWLLTGMSEVNSSLQGINNMSSLTELALTCIIKYLSLPAGALYVYNEEKQKLVLQSSFALPAAVIKTFNVGEGIIGAAGNHKEIQVIKDVPPGYWALKSGTGTAMPGQIVCVPLWYNNELKGVIELVSFRSVEELEIKLLSNVSNNLAIAINATDAREKIVRLLEQVQIQKENLQQQEEELRQSNEELTQQAEILQTSEEELKVQEEELRQINAELIEKNEAVEIARQSLAIKAKELEITGKYKSEFLANMSHELRTPLNSVMILAKLLSENKDSNLNTKQVEYANIIHKSGNDLLTLINDILDLSKIEAGKIDLHFEKVSVKEICNDLKQLFYVVAEEKLINFNADVDAALPQKIWTDKLRLEQIIKNLLSNSFKFTGKGGSIHLSFNMVDDPASLPYDEVRNSNKVLLISVTDTGIGIAAEKQRLIFEAFQQADGSTSRKYGGTGLGLSISKELIKRLGGTISLKSEEGKGSTFYIYLPLDKKISNAPLKDVTEYIASPQSFENIAEQAQIPDDRRNIFSGDKVMLIIEDDLKFAGLLQEFARNKNYKTIIALQGDEGLYYAIKYKPSAIILDIQLPVIDGRTLLRTIKENRTLKNIPVHVISAYDESIQSAPGAIAYLKKPLNKENLDGAFSLIGNYLENGIKKVLVLSGDYLKDNSLKHFIDDRHFDMECTYSNTVNDAVENLRTKEYDCVIADIGKDLKKGITQLQLIKPYLQNGNTPVVIYMDRDLSAADELELKKLTNIIIRDSSHAKDRLMDELELFLYRVQDAEKVALPRSQAAIADDKVLHGKKVLLVDDDVRNVFALGTLLEEQNMEIFTASNGKEALEQMESNPDVNLVLMDIMMPEMDGFEAIKRLRSDQRFTKLPVIALTAKAMQGDKEKVINVGASDYISKPIDNNRLLSLIRVWLS